MRTLKVLSLIIVSFCLCGLAFGWATENFGPDTQIGHPTTAQSGWPTGIVAIPRHPSRTYSMWCNGGENFYFKATTKQVNEIITRFSKANLRDHEIWIKTNKPKVLSFDKKVIDYNISLQITGGIARYFLQEKNPVETFEPDLTIYVDGNLSWIRDLVIPANIILHTEIYGFTLKSWQSKPKRNSLHGQIQYGDSPGPEDFMRGLRAKITLWENGNPNFFKVAHAGRDGYFTVPLSEQELSDLQSGKSKLRVTIGNYLTQPKKTDLLFPPSLLAAKPKLKPFIINRPGFYYGRILFEDDTPPALNPLPWSDGDISVTFSYAGNPQIDKNGSFKVFFTDEQYKKLIAGKDRKNIYIPSYTKKQQSTAKHIFPVSLLSKDKNKPGTIKIPRPKIPGGQSKIFKEDTNGNFILYVSNQSYAVTPVDIQVLIDNKKVIDQKFDVGTQHNWIPFYFKASQGIYSLQVKSKKGKAVLNTTFKITDKNWAVIDYWNYPKVSGGAGPTPAKFSFNIQDKPIGFK